jgi:hypothetical protein
LEAEKASTVDKIVLLGHKIAYGSYHTIKYTGYAIGIGFLEIGYLITYPFAKAYSQIKK